MFDKFENLEQVEEQVLQDVSSVKTKLQRENFTLKYQEMLDFLGKEENTIALREKFIKDGGEDYDIINAIESTKLVLKRILSSTDRIQIIDEGTSFLEKATESRDSKRTRTQIRTSKRNERIRAAQILHESQQEEPEEQIQPSTEWAKKRREARLENQETNQELKDAQTFVISRVFYEALPIPKENKERILIEEMINFIQDNKFNGEGTPALRKLLDLTQEAYETKGNDGVKEELKNEDSELNECISTYSKGIRETILDAFNESRKNNRKEMNSVIREKTKPELLESLFIANERYLSMVLESAAEEKQILAESITIATMIETASRLGLFDSSISRIELSDYVSKLPLTT